MNAETTIDQSDEDILTSKVSDEALEAAAGTQPAATPFSKINSLLCTPWDC